MSRAVPSYDTLAAIAGAFDARDRRSNRPVLPVRPITSRPLMQSEIVARLCGIRDDIGAALAADPSWERDLAICAANRRIDELARQIEVSS